MRSLQTGAVALSVALLWAAAGVASAPQRQTQVRPSAGLRKDLALVVRPARVQYVPIDSRAALLRIQPLFSAINQLTRGNGSATANPLTGAVSGTVIDDGNSCAVAGFWGSGLANTGGTGIAGVTGSASVQVTQLVGEAQLWMVVYDGSSSTAITITNIPIRKPGTFTIHSGVFNMEPGKQYSLVSYLTVPMSVTLNSNPIHPNPTRAAMALSGKFESVKFTIG